MLILFAAGAASQTKFTILTYGENYTHLSPTELSADFSFSSLQRFGEQFVKDYIDAHRLPINILQRVSVVSFIIFIFKNMLKFVFISQLSVHDHVGILLGNTNRIMRCVISLPLEVSCLTNIISLFLINKECILFNYLNMIYVFR